MCREAFGGGPERRTNASAASITDSTSRRPISRTGRSAGPAALRRGLVLPMPTDPVIYCDTLVNAS
jgi:hypothetical protein